MPARSKRAATTGLEVAGAGLIVTGVALIWIPAAFLVAGALLIGISYLVVSR